MSSDAVKIARSHLKGIAIGRLCTVGKIEETYTFKQDFGFKETNEAVMGGPESFLRVGGYIGTLTIRGSAEKKGKGTSVVVTGYFRLENTMGLHSYNRHWWLLAPDDKTTPGPYSNFKMIMIWFEDFTMECTCCP